MKITKEHYDFWVHKSTNPPKLFDGLTSKPSIHKLINTNADIKFDSQLHNTLLILSSARGRGRLLLALEEMATSPKTVINPKRRAANCKKWLTRMQK